MSAIANEVARIEVGRIADPEEIEDHQPGGGAVDRHDDRDEEEDDDGEGGSDRVGTEEDGVVQGSFGPRAATGDGDRGIFENLSRKCQVVGCLI